MKRDILGVLLAVFVVCTAIFLLWQMYRTPKKETTDTTIKMESQAETHEEMFQEVKDVVQHGDVIEPRSDYYYYIVDLLARVIHRENSNEVDGEPACWKTGSVIMNRVASKKYPNSIEGVIMQKGQYDCINSLYDEEPTDIEVEVAAELINSGSILPEDVLYAAEFVQGSGEYDREGNTIYCRE